MGGVGGLSRLSAVTGPRFGGYNFHSSIVLIFHGSDGLWHIIVLLKQSSNGTMMSLPEAR